MNNLMIWGYTANPWALGLRDVILGFGVLGGLVFMVLFGWLAQRLFRVSRASDNALHVVGLAFITSCCFIFRF